MARGLPAGEDRDVTEVNPRCTAFCRGPKNDSVGHPEVPEEDIGAILGQVLAGGLRPEPCASTVQALYRRGHGYHAIADALGCSHEEAFLLLTRTVP